MCFRNHPYIRICRLFCLCVLLPIFLLGETKTWTGYGGDTNWLNPLNWSGTVVPQTTDDVLLDNGDLPVSYQVVLPDIAILVRTLRINPSPGRNIELVLPATNKITDAFSVTGPGYGIELDAGAVFRNASGISSGESLHISDSMIIHDGARYVHQTRAAHANGILKILSTAPGTEQGIFDFDVPRASYTISVSNRIYGSLELHSTAFGSMVNYTCSGSNPLLIRGNLRIAPNVTMSIDLGGIHGNIQIEGDFIQEGGQLNLASGIGDNTVMHIRGDLYQSPFATITETSSGMPFIELDGNRLQEIALAGRLLNQVGFRLNNAAGGELHMPLTLPWKLELLQGAVTSTATALLSLDTGCSVVIDSARLAGACVAGPLRKLGLNQEAHFLFPVGSDGNLRWLALKNARGNYTVEYIHQNPVLVGSSLGPGLDHISKLEYWTIIADSTFNNQAIIELSFASVQSGTVTDPNYLNVAAFQSSQWEDAGHTSITGNFIQGSVLSGNTDFIAQAFTLASTLDLENPLPQTTIEFVIKEISEQMVFSWTIQTSEIPDHYYLYEETGGLPVRIAEIKAIDRQKNYSWTLCQKLKTGNHYFSIRMVDIHGIEYSGVIIQYKKLPGNQTIQLVSSNGPGASVQLLIQLPVADNWTYEIFSINGYRLEKGSLKLDAGKNIISVGSGLMSNGVYIFRAMDSAGKNYTLLFVKS